MVKYNQMIQIQFNHYLSIGSCIFHDLCTTHDARESELTSFAVSLPLSLSLNHSRLKLKLSSNWFFVLKDDKRAIQIQLFPFAARKSKILLGSRTYIVYSSSFIHRFVLGQLVNVQFHSNRISFCSSFNFCLWRCSFRFERRFLLSLIN